MNGAGTARAAVARGAGRASAWPLILLVVGCTVTTDADETARELALEFTRALAAREYDRAYGMTASEYRDRVSRAGLQEAFETMIPPDWGETEPVQVMTSMSDWPDKGAHDVGWVYVSIAGDVYSEALAVVITREGGGLKIREVQWGRP